MNKFRDEMHKFFANVKPISLEERLKRNQQRLALLYSHQVSKRILEKNTKGSK